MSPPARSPRSRGGRRAQQGELWENMITRPSCSILGLLSPPAAAAGATYKANQPREDPTRPSWRSTPPPRPVPAPVPAAPPSPLRQCCPVWAWSMRDGVDRLQAKAEAMRAFSWWPCAGNSPWSPPPYTGLPPSRLCIFVLPPGSGICCKKKCVIGYPSLPLITAVIMTHTTCATALVTCVSWQ
jgi:hypothetical protein